MWIYTDSESNIFVFSADQWLIWFPPFSRPCANADCWIFILERAIESAVWRLMQNFIQVNWRPVLGGLALQFFFAAMILKWDVGQAVFEFLGNQVQTFLEFTNTGTKFVFGDKYTDHPFAMVVCNRQDNFMYMFLLPPQGLFSISLKF